MVMVAPKCPGTEVREDPSCEACGFPRRLATVHWNHRKTIQLNIGMCFEEYKRGFGVPTLIAVHPENDPKACKLNWNDGCKDSVLGRLF